MDRAEAVAKTHRRIGGHIASVVRSVHNYYGDPMVLVEQITPVASLLLDAAASEGTASFKKLHLLFDSGSPINDRYDTLEAAARALCPSAIAIYSAVLSKKETGCPGDGFFDAFKNMRPAEYREIAGDCITQELTDEQMLAITLAERRRVYEHVASHF